MIGDAAAVEVPADVDPALAGALGIAGLAGWLPFAWRAPLHGGETVLVLGATGAVGLVAVQAAKLLGAARVVAAGRDPERLAKAAKLGADATVQLGEHDDLTAALREAAGGDGPDYVFDALWGAPVGAAIRSAARGARIVNLGQSAGPTAELASGDIRGKGLTILGHVAFSVPHDVLAEHYPRPRPPRASPARSSSTSSAYRSPTLPTHGAARPPARRRSSCSCPERQGATSRCAAASQRQTAAGTRWVPPTQRSTPSSSTRSASPASDPLAVRVRRSGSAAKSCPSPSGGGGGSSLAVRASRRAGRRRGRAPRARGRTTCRRGTAPARAPAPRGSRGRSARAAGDRLQRRRSVRESPSPGAGSSSSSRRAPARGTAARGDSRAGQLGERLRVGRAEGVPGRRRRLERSPSTRPPRRPERLELLRGQLAEAAERRLARGTSRRRSAPAPPRPRARARARRAAAAGRRGRARTRARRARRRRARRASWRSRRSSDERIARRLPQPQSDEERGPRAQQLRSRDGRHRPLVEHVLPREHGAAERGLAQRVAGALAVRHVQERRAARPARGRGARGRRRRTCSGRASRTRSRRRARARRASAAAPRSARRSRRSSPPSARAAPPTASVERRDAREVLADLREREADRLRLLDRAQEPNRLLVVAAVAARLPLGLREQAPALVVAERLDVHARPLRDLADSHARDDRPVPRYGCQVARARPATRPAWRPA